MNEDFKLFLIINRYITYPKYITNITLKIP